MMSIFHIAIRYCRQRRYLLPQPAPPPARVNASALNPAVQTVIKQSNTLVAVLLSNIFLVSIFQGETS